jgi:hypothetical protein
VDYDIDLLAEDLFAELTAGGCIPERRGCHCWWRIPEGLKKRELRMGTGSAATLVVVCSPNLYRQQLVVQQYTALLRMVLSRNRHRALSLPRPDVVEHWVSKDEVG